MKNKKKLKELYKKDLEKFFDSFEEILRKENQKLTYVILGGAALVLLEVIPRSTADIDIVRGDLDKLVTIGARFGIEIQKVSQCTTVDFDECPKLGVYLGENLEIVSISLEDLLKSKIERCYKQDPQDIAGIISHAQLSYQDFKKIFNEMLKDFVGNADRLVMHARTIVDVNYPDHVDDFYQFFKLSR